MKQTIQDRREGDGLHHVRESDHEPGLDLFPKQRDDSARHAPEQLHDEEVDEQDRAEGDDHRCHVLVVVGAVVVEDGLDRPFGVQLVRGQPADRVEGVAGDEGGEVEELEGRQRLDELLEDHRDLEVEVDVELDQLLQLEEHLDEAGLPRGRGHADQQPRDYEGLAELVRQSVLHREVGEVVADLYGLLLLAQIRRASVDLLGVAEEEVDLASRLAGLQFLLLQFDDVGGVVEVLRDLVGGRLAVDRDSQVLGDPPFEGEPALGEDQDEAGLGL